MSDLRTPHGLVECKRTVSVVYEVRLCGRVVDVSDRRDEAIAFAKRYRGAAEVWCVSGTIRVVDGTERILPEKDRARGASAHLKGQRSKFTALRGPGRIVEARVW